MKITQKYYAFYCFNILELMVQCHGKNSHVSLVTLTIPARFCSA
jgi:hypothetical protein